MRKALGTGLFLVCVAAAYAAAAAPPSTINHQPSTIPLGHPPEGEASPPYGASDFYPSPDHPFGWRGDGTACWPGATPVTEWREGTPERAPVRDLADPDRVHHRNYVLADRKAKNIVWKTRMPCYANSQPIVAGDRVFSHAEPYYLVCCDVNTGKILWVRENNPFDFGGKSEEEADALTTFMEQLYVMGGLFRHIVGGYTRHPTTATAGALPMWMRHARWMEHLLLEMNRGPCREGVQEALPAIDALLRELAALNPGDKSGHIEGPQCKAVTLPTVWFNEKTEVIPYAMWDGWIGRTFAAPETDGEFVYTMMGQGQVACYDLAGKRIWARHLATLSNQDPTTRGSRLGGNNCAHPRLVANVLCVYPTTGPKDCDALYGLDKKTGKTLWSTADERAFQGVARGSGWLRIPRPNGTVLHALASNEGAVIRVTDGEILAAHGLAYNHGPDEQGHSDIVVGNRWYVNEKSSVVAFELSATNDDKVTFKELWKAPVKQYCRSPILYDGYLYRLGKGNEIIKLADGSTRAAEANKGTMFTVNPSYPSPIIAGGYLMGYASCGRTVPFVALAQTLKIGENGMPKMVADTNAMDGDPIPHMPRYEKHLPGYRPGDIFSNCGATPTQFGYACPAANANRLFIRSVSQLYCIGDPSVPYSWNPASRPQRITEKLEAAAKALAERDPVDALKSPYAWDRELGRKALAEMPAAEQKARLDGIAALTAGDGWRTLKEAAATLRDMGKTASPALPQLVKSLEKWIDAKSLNRSAELLTTIRAINTSAAKQIVPKLQRALGSGDADSMIVAARLAAQMGKDAGPLTVALTKALASGNDRVVWDAALALKTAGLSDKSTIPALAAATKRNSRWTAIAALDALAARGPAAVAALEAITDSLKSKDVRIVTSAEKIIASLGPKAKPAAPALMSVLANKDIRCAVQAADTLASLGPAHDKQLSVALIKNLAGKDDVVSKANARSLGNVGPKFKTMAHKIDAIEALIKALQTRNATVKRESAIALGKFGTDAGFAADALRHAALGKECAVQAKEALAKVAPGTNLKKRIEPESEVDIDDLDL